jgi:hypothetical protein
MYCFYRGARKLEVLKPEDIKDEKGSFGDAVRDALRGLRKNFKGEAVKYPFNSWFNRENLLNYEITKS